MQLFFGAEYRHDQSTADGMGCLSCAVLLQFHSTARKSFVNYFCLDRRALEEEGQLKVLVFFGTFYEYHPLTSLIIYYN
jgi:hypothetical protein